MFASTHLLRTAHFMEILTASLRDLNPLRRLEHACFGADAWSLFDLVAVLTFPDVVRLKAVVGRDMVGFVAGDPRPAQGFSWIATIGVLPAFQRQGIGGALLRACEGQLRTPRVRLSVRLQNGPAIRLYEREGYQRMNVWHAYYNDGGDALVMEKEL